MLAENNQAQSIIFGEHELILSGLGALYWPAQHMLVIADLHLEKGSYYAKRGNPLPLYDTLDTLKRLEHLIAVYKPQRVLSLGDNIHDTQAFLRMSAEGSDLFKQIIASIDEWVWLMGNHDKEVIPDNDKLSICTQLEIGNLTFTHDFLPNKPWQIVGHYHPKAAHKHIRGKCFLVNAQKIMMPSFGSYTGGLNIDSLAFKKIMGDEVFRSYLLNRDKIWRIR